jgi:hypothetical protein
MHDTGRDVMAQTREQSTLATQRGAVQFRPPRQMLLGLALIAIVWPIAWLQPRPISDYSFSPLWLGYILAVDGVVLLRVGSSPISRHGWRVIWLFFASIPLWWLCELIDKAPNNWHYETPRHYGTLEYLLFASLAFSTVTPAVLTTTELVRSFKLNPLRRFGPRPIVGRTLLLSHFAGWLMLAALIVFPRQAYPLIWLSLIFILDPIVDRLGGRSVASYLRRGDWSLISNLALATLVCGWFWEMWNFYSLPKWHYSVPYVGFWHVWEMPLLGYGGYLPFGVEVFVFYQLVAALLRLWVTLPWTRVAVGAR